jgi:hypothetical protein
VTETVTKSDAAGEKRARAREEAAGEPLGALAPRNPSQPASQVPNAGVL